MGESLACHWATAAGREAASRRARSSAVRSSVALAQRGVGVVEVSEVQIDGLHAEPLHRRLGCGADVARRQAPELRVLADLRGQADIVGSTVLSHSPTTVSLSPP
jgi:hypothetical protein